MNLMTRQDLTKAFELIEQERHDAALEILEPLLQEERNNPDVWWLYAHATADRETARDALNMVLLLKPDYPGASQLLEQLRIEPVSAGTHPITSSPAYTPPPTLPDLPPAETEEDDFDDLDFEDFDDDKPRSRLRTFLGMLFVLLIIGVIAVILIMNA
ncbi:MAG: tetratricopeptide repeat protein, partial [Chloroflexi bacterium]